jgi:putative inorganic carbon (HCO3(-)) transporter
VLTGNAALRECEELGYPSVQRGWHRPAYQAAEARTDAKWDPLLVCVAGYILAAVGRIHQLFPVLEIFRPAVLCGVLAIVLFVLDTGRARTLQRLVGRPTKFVLALFAWAALSVPGALVASNSFDVVFNNLMKTMLMYLVIVGSVRGLRDVERLVLVYLASAALYAAVVILRFDLGSGDAWRLGRLYYYDANDFATYAVSAMPLGVYALHSLRRRTMRWATAVALTLLALAFVHTGSRGGFIALVGVATFTVARYTAIPLRWRVSATTLIVVVVLATASGQYWQQMGTILSDADYNRTEETGRLQIWTRGVGYMLRHPVFGVGPGNFQSAEGSLSRQAVRQQFGIGVRWNAAHNTLIQIGAETGVPGLLLFLAVIAAAFGALRSAARASVAAREYWRLKNLTQALTAAMIGFLIGAFFLSLAYSEMLFTLVALAACLQKAATIERQRFAAV